MSAQVTLAKGEAGLPFFRVSFLHGDYDLCGGEVNFWERIDGLVDNFFFFYKSCQKHLSHLEFVAGLLTSKIFVLEMKKCLPHFEKILTTGSHQSLRLYSSSRSRNCRPITSLRAKFQIFVLTLHFLSFFHIYFLLFLNSLDTFLILLPVDFF